LATTTKSKKIHQLAKELGVDSKTIIAKCQAEEIPGADTMTHMSPVGPGLEQTIREWFTDVGGRHPTAVEISEPVHVDSPKKSPAVRKRPTSKKEQTKQEKAPGSGAESTPLAVVAPAELPAPAATVVAPALPEKAPVVEPVSPPKHEVPALKVQPTPPPAPPPTPPPVHKATAVPRTPPPPVAVPNIPRRPEVVKPVGERLKTPQVAKLTGPKVVRVEQPEPIQPPRPRRPGPVMPNLGTTRGGTGAPATEDERGRSPRRKAGDRRSSGGGIPERRRALSDVAWEPGGHVFSEQDLIERENRLSRATGFLRKRQQDAGRKPVATPETRGPVEGKVRIVAPFTIKDLSEETGVKASEIVKRLFMQGIMKKINDPIEVEKAIEVMMDFNIDLEVVEAKTAEETVSEQFLRREAKDVRARGPVVTILGHVDHGKTSLLDRIRNTNVAAGEAGGITQKTSAFVAEVEVEGQKKQVVFLDTPGHEAFTGMRARGAKITDIVVLVVSAPEGVMPQTIESINHAKAAGVPIVVALNKVDRPDATEQQIQKTLGELAKAGVNPVEWGGETEVVRVSAVTGQGIKQLLEVLDYQAQLLDLKADFDGPAQGTVIEARMEEGRGAVANLLIQQGRLKVGDTIVMGRAFGRVREILDDRGRRVKEAVPPMPVQVSGIDLVCDAGDKFFATRSLREAEEAAEQRRQRERETQLAQPKLTLDSLFSQMQTQDVGVQEIRLILKTDQQGTVDVLKSECEKVKSDAIRTRVLHAAVGGITESDVILADASKAVIIGFNVVPSGKARTLAEQKGVEIRTYQVIYDITEDLRKAAQGMLAPEIREEILGHAEVRAVFRITKVGNVAGCYITDGTVQRDALIRVTRDGIVIEHDRRLAQLKRVKEDVREVRAGMECGMRIDGYDDIKEGDVLECYRKVEVARTL
jgi:translation initiation factor IF-2